MRNAVALAGSRADGEDLLQAALERLVRNWHRVESDPEAYLWRTLYHLAADGWRSRGRWRARLAEFRSQALENTGGDDVAVVDLRDELVRLLHQLPPRQRAVIVLRYWEHKLRFASHVMAKGHPCAWSCPARVGAYRKDGRVRTGHEECTLDWHSYKSDDQEDIRLSG
jgi:hypothetical protein